MKSLADLTLPPGFSAVIDADGLELFDPSGKRVALFGPAYSVVAVEDVAWITHEEEAVSGLMRIMAAEVKVIASDTDRYGNTVRLQMQRDEVEALWFVRWSDGGIWGVSEYTNETDARREYDRKVRSVGSMA